MTTTAATHRTLAALNLPTPVPALISVARGIVQSLMGNPSFPSLASSLATVTSAIDDLETAQTATQSRTRGAAETRNDKRAVLVTLLDQLKASVQKVADADRETAPAVIQSGGLSVKKTAARSPRVFGAKPGAVSGTIDLVAQSAGHRAAYEWESSRDAGKTWAVVPPTLQARTTVAGLIPGATVSFRYRALTRMGEGDWSQPVSIIVR